MTTDKVIGFVALTPMAATEIKENKVCTPEMFGYPKRWIPFTDTPEEALEKLWAATGLHPSAARAKTKVWILEVCFGKEQALTYIGKNELLRYTWALPIMRGACTPVSGWQFFGNVHLDADGGDTTAELMERTVEPLGIDGWGMRALSKYTHAIGGSCSACGKETPTWFKCRITHAYCALCWADWLLRQEHQGSEV